MPFSTILIRGLFIRKEKSSTYLQVTHPVRAFDVPIRVAGRLLLDPSVKLRTKGLADDELRVSLAHKPLNRQCLVGRFGPY
jgi:hypothetical protein